jgi:hypothetical protein
VTSVWVPFTDLVSGAACALVIPPGGQVYPAVTQQDAKIGVSHPGCDLLADLCAELDSFFCPACRWNGRVSGAWAVDMIREVAG